MWSSWYSKQSYRRTSLSTYGTWIQDIVENCKNQTMGAGIKMKNISMECIGSRNSAL